jgi:hypothetical protein
MRGKKTVSFSAITALFMVLLLSTSIAPMTATIAPIEQPKPTSTEEQPLQSQTMTVTSGETINFTSNETMTISAGNNIKVWSGVEMNFTSIMKMQIMEVGASDGILQPCDWIQVISPGGYMPEFCSWWEVLDPSSGKPLGEIHVDENDGIDQFHIDITYPGPIVLPGIDVIVTAVKKIDVIEPCEYFEVHWPADWYPTPCTWWELVDPETGQLTGVEFHVDWTNESCEFHIDQVLPGPYILPFPWYMLKARMKIPGLAPCDYFVVEEPPDWYPAPCTWWEVLDPLSGEPTGFEFHVDWTNESCEFHIDEVLPAPFDFQSPVPFFEAEQGIANITSCDWFTIENPAGSAPVPCSWWEVLDPSGVPTGIEFHIDEVGQGIFHVDQVTPTNPVQFPWYPPTATITVVRKIDTIMPCNWFKVADPATTPAPCTWWKVISPDIGDVEFHVDFANQDGTFHVDIVEPVTTFLPTYAIAAEQKIDTLQPCDWFVVIDPPTGWLPPACSWWRITWPTEWAGVTFHVDSNDGISQFHIDNVIGQLTPRTPPPWNVTAERYTPTLPWYMKSPYPDYAPSGMPDFDQRQNGTFWWNLTSVWDYCGPVAVANSLWWLDSEFEPNTIPPPTIIDNFPLVQAYGPWDDHDPLNVPPLVEHLAYLMDTDGLRTGPGMHSGTDVFDMETGITQYLSWSGVNPLGDVDGDGSVTMNDFNIVTSAFGSIPGSPNWDMRADIFPATIGYPPVADNVIDMNDVNLVTQNMGSVGLFHEHTELAPTWDYIVEQVMACQDVELLLVPWYFDPTGQGWYRYDEGAHYVTVAGLNATTWEIVFSDPIRDNAEAGGPGDVPVPHMHMQPEPPYITHNDALYVSHDMYHVVPEECPGGPLTIPDFFGGAIPPPGPYPDWKIQIEAAVVTCPFEVNVHDVAVTNITTSKTGCLPKETVGVGKILKLNVTVENQGTVNETSNVRVYANNTQIGVQSVTLNQAEVKTLTFNWDTTGYAKGNYWINATIDTVPLETDTADNSMGYGWTFVTLAGDVDGNHSVNILDIVRMAGVYGVRLPDPRYNPNCDLDGDGDIDILDIVVAAGNYGQSW